MGSVDVNRALQFFEKNHYAYDNPRASVTTPIAKQFAECLLQHISQIDEEKFKSLPAATKIYVLKDDDGSHLKKYLDAKLSGLLINQSASEATIKACVEQLIDFDDETGHLSIKGKTLINHASVVKLIASLPKAMLDQVKSIDLSSCRCVESLETLLEPFQKLTTVNISNLIRLGSLKGIESLASSVEKIDAQGLTKLKSIQELNGCSQLKKLNLTGASLLDDPRPLAQLTGLEELTFDKCYSLKFMETLLPKLTNLTLFSIKKVPKYQNLSLSKS